MDDVIIMSEAPAKRKKSKTEDGDTKRRKKKKLSTNVMIVPDCAICLSKLSMPILMCISNNDNCGQTFHQKCIDRWLSTTCKDGSVACTCPSCNTTFKPARNRTMETLLESLGVDCTNKAQGCKVFMPQYKMHEHHRVCPFRWMECSALHTNCKWRGMEAERAKHEATCMFLIFGKQAVESVQQIQAAGNLVLEKIQAGEAKLQALKTATEQRLRKFDQIKRTFTVENCTKHYLIPVRTQEHPLNIQNVTMKFKLDVDTYSATKEICFSILSIHEARLPVACLAVLFIVNTDITNFLRKTSKTKSFILTKEQPSCEIFRTQQVEKEPLKMTLNITLVVKLFY